MCGFTRIAKIGEMVIPKGFEGEVINILRYKEEIYLRWKWIPLCFCDLGILMERGCQCGGE